MRRSIGRLARSCTALACAVAFTALMAQAATGATTLSAVTDTHEAGAPATLSVTLSVSGPVLATRLRAGSFATPGALPVDDSRLGSSAQLCPSAGAFTQNGDDMGYYYEFSKVSCPTTSIVGTAILGSLSGFIYAVAGTVPQFGVYFTTGTGSPFGRKLTMTRNSDGSTAFSIAGLPDISTSGLTLNFNNPSRPGGLPSSIFRWASRGSQACIPRPEVSGSSVHPMSVDGVNPDQIRVTATPDILNLFGCDKAVQVLQDSTQPGQPVALQITTSLFPASETQHGQIIDLPPNVHINYPALATGCPNSAVGASLTTIKPGGKLFSPTSCPASAIVGTVSLGSQTGKIYLLNQYGGSGAFGIWIDQGVTQPYGRLLNLTWPHDLSAGENQYAELSVYSLQGAPGTALRLDFNPPDPSRPKYFGLATADDPTCAAARPTTTLYSYPTIGNIAPWAGPITADSSITVAGCQF